MPRALAAGGSLDITTRVTTNTSNTVPMLSNPYFMSSCQGMPGPTGALSGGPGSRADWRIWLWSAAKGTLSNKRASGPLRRSWWWVGGLEPSSRRQEPTRVPIDGGVGTGPLISRGNTGGPRQIGSDVTPGRPVIDVLAPPYLLNAEFPASRMTTRVRLLKNGLSHCCSATCFG